MRHFRRVLLAAIALGLLVAMLGVGRAQAAEPASAWTTAPTYARQAQASDRITTLADGRTVLVADWV